MIGCKKEESGGKLRKMWEGWVEYMGGSDGSEGGSRGAYTLGTAPGTTNFIFFRGAIPCEKVSQYIYLSNKIRGLWGPNTKGLLQAQLILHFQRTINGRIFAQE